MSGWTDYIKNLLSSSDCIKKAAIVGSADGGVWARTEGDLGDDFNASADELKKFVGLFNDLAKVPETGFVLEGIKYIVPRCEDNLIFGKKGSTGIFAAKTSMAVLIALYEGETAKGQECRKAVEALAAYLSQSGY